MTSPSVRLSLLVLVLVAPLSGHQEPSAAPTGQPFVAGATAVVVDAVVRDGRGNPVVDLRKEDFELLEDGERQEIADLVAIGGDTRRRSRSTMAPPSEPLVETHGAMPAATFTAIVFDRLSPDTRARVAKAGQALVDTLQEDEYAAVFVADQTLGMLHTYTTDRAALRKVLQDFARFAPSTFELEPSRLAHPREGIDESAVRDDAIGRVRIGEAAVMAANAARVAWHELQALQHGYAATNALLAVTTGLRPLPGRKSVVYFSEGAPIRDQVLRHFRHVIEYANSSNVSFYTVDAAGLRVHSTEAQIQHSLQNWGADRVGDAFRSPRTTMMLLARETGGTFTENTNDLSRAARRVAEDRRFHYLLSYTPKNTDFKGEWRAVTVRVARRGAEVRARSGYVADRSPTSLSFLAYEALAIAALERSPAPADLPLRASALVFPEGDQSRVAVLAAVDAAALRFDRDETAGTFRTDFSIVARIKDAAGAVVRKGSEPYRLDGTLQQLESARRGEVLFFKHPTLEPGTYTLEVAVHDALAGTWGVHRSTFAVPAARPELDVGSLVLVARAERVSPDERQPGNPLYVGEVVVYPNLGEPLSASRDKALTFLVLARTSAGAPPAATLEVVREGQALAQAPIALSPPDATGRIEHVAQIPLEGFAPGRYTLRLTIDPEGASELRDAAFEVIR